MRIGALGRMVILSSLLVLAFGGAAWGQDRDRFAREAGLDVDLINLVSLDVGGVELTVVFVFINERTFDSLISEELRTALLPYIGQNALYVNPNIKNVVTEFGFDPDMISVEAAADVFTPRAEDWVEITPGFLDGRFDVNPAGASQGSGSEGILILGDAIDADAPFEVRYGAERATFSIAPEGATGSTSAGLWGATSGSLSHDPIAVPLMEDAQTLEELLALPDFTSEAMAAMLGLTTDDVQVVEVSPSSTQSLRFVYIRLDDDVRLSTLGEGLLTSLEPLIGAGAVMVWAYSATGAKYTPYSHYFQQAETNYVLISSASFVDLTSGFSTTAILAPAELVAGVLRVPASADPSSPYKVMYGLNSAYFP